VRGSYVGVLMGFTNAAPKSWVSVRRDPGSEGWVEMDLLALVNPVRLHTHEPGLVLPRDLSRLAGDGSAPATGVNTTVLAFARRAGKKEVAEPGPKQHLQVPRLVKIFAVWADGGCLPVIVVGSVVYTVFGCLSASQSGQYIELYGLDYLETGPFTLFLGLVPSLPHVPLVRTRKGRYGALDYDYTVTAKRPGLLSAKGKGMDSLTSPLRRLGCAASDISLALLPLRL
jgi:hypothetical protein